MAKNTVDPALPLPISFEETTQRVPRPKAAKVRTKKNKHTIKLLAAALILIVTLIIILLIQSFKSIKCQTEAPICSTQECTLSAASLINSLHRNEDPCEDFYSFVCGKGNDATPDVFQILTQELLIKLKGLLMKPPSTSEAEVIIKVKQFYQECMNTSKIQELELKPLKELLQRIASGWPWLPEELEQDYASKNERTIDHGIQNPSNASNKTDDFASGDLKTEAIMNSGVSKMPMTLEHLLGKLAKSGLLPNKLFSVGVINDFNDWHVQRIIVSQPEPKEGIKRQKKKKAVEDDKLFETKVDSLISLVNNNENSAKVKNEIGRMLSLKKQLKNMNAIAKDQTNITLRMNKLSIAELIKLTQNKFKWLDYFNTVFDGILPTKLNESEIITIDGKQFFEKLPNIFGTFNTRTIANFAVWDALIEPLLEHVFAPNVSDLIEENRCIQICVPTISEMFPFVLGRLFTDTYTDDSILESGKKFIQLLRESYKNIISRSKWLDRSTKRNAIKKLDGMTEQVGFPIWIKNDTKLDNYYRDVVIGENHVSNVLSVIESNQKRELTKFGRNSTKSWTDDIGVVKVNAFYVPTSNSIIFPIGIIQTPFYQDNRLTAMNFGGVGSVIGHEIGHAFDNVGSQFDENGQLWSLWSENSKKIYDQKTQCYVNQYNDYCFQGISGGSNNTCVDGLLTVGENVPDNAGMRAAFHAYNTWTKMHNKEKRLPGLADFTPEQIFFMSYAYIWCEAGTVEDWISSGSNTDDPHSPVRYRVQGVLSNFDEFAKAYSCKKGAMNRMDERCTLW